MHHHRTQLLMGVRARTVAMPGPQTARTVNPLGGKGAGTIHGYQIMTAPRRHPLQHLAALGALQYLLKRPPIPHRRDRIQATAQSRVAGNLRQTVQTTQIHFHHLVPVPRYIKRQQRGVLLQKHRQTRHQTVTGGKLPAAYLLNDRLKYFTNHPQQTGLAHILAQLQRTHPWIPRLSGNSIVTYHPSSNDKPTLLLLRKPMRKVHTYSGVGAIRGIAANRPLLRKPQKPKDTLDSRTLRSIKSFLPDTNYGEQSKSGDILLPNDRKLSV